MTRRSKLWRAAAIVFVIVNVAGIGWGLAEGDLAHAATHAVLLAGLGAFAIWRSMSQRKETAAVPQLSEQRIEYLQQSVDAIALEVERIGEKQRFADKLRAAQSEIPVKKEQ